MLENNKVPLRAYLIQLCESLGASMIADRNRVTITVTMDDSVVDADVSVSLGLIVTELIINALKHAFPGDASGKVKVSYQSTKQDWTLTVSDDGVGMPSGSDSPKAGLGTGIVEALAKNLDCKVTSSDARPGTAVSITHKSDQPPLG